MFANNRNNKFDLSSLFGIVVFSIFYFTSPESANTIYCIGDSSNAFNIDIVDAVESIKPAVEIKKNEWSYFSYRNVGIAAISFVIIAALIYSRGGGGDSGTALDFKAVHWGSDTSSEAGADVLADVVAAAGNLPVVDQILPVAAASVALAVPGLLDVSIATGSSVFALSSQAQEVLTATITQHPEVSSSLLEVLEIEGFTYYSNFLESLRDPFVQSALRYLCGTGFSDNSLFNVLRYSSENALRLISEFQSSIHNPSTDGPFSTRDSENSLIVLACSVISPLFISLSIETEAFQEIVPVLCVFALQCMKEPLIVAALEKGNGYSVISSIFIDTFFWSLVNGIITKNVEGLDTIIKFLEGKEVSGLSLFEINTFQSLIEDLKGRGFLGIKITIDGSFIIVKTIGLILKEYISKKIYLLV